MEVVTDGIVLKARPYGERDMILTLLTPEHGRITVLARSVGKKQKAIGSVRAEFRLFPLRSF